MQERAIDIRTRADRGYALRVGGVVRSGPAQEISQADDIRQAYLGV